MCTDKKPAAINYIMGRGKSVLAEARLPEAVVHKIFHTDSATLTKLTITKHWLGSALAGSPGMAGCNAHAANIVAALFAATGQDLAQVSMSVCPFLPFQAMHPLPHVDICLHCFRQFPKL